MTFSQRRRSCFRQNRVGFVSPKSVAVPVRAQVARVIVNNNRKQWIGARKRLLQPEVGSSFSVISISRFQTAHLVPACTRGLQPCFANPNRGWAERRETFGCSAEHPLGTP